jgi:tripartite-type tricarboxylate transporter receptor subunit TctC
VTPQIQAGTLTALAVTGLQRMEKLPDTPTVLETKLVDYTNQAGAFILGPKGMPADVQVLLNKEFAAALDIKEVRERLMGLGLTIPESRDNTVAAVKKHIDDFTATYGKLITEMGIKAE